MVRRFGSGDALALAAFTLALAAAPIWNEGMYSYYAVPQRALFWAMAAWLCLFPWETTRHRRWAVLGAALSFLACGTYEIGYVFALLALVPIWLYRGRQGCHSKPFQYACYAFYPVHMLLLVLALNFVNR